MEENDGETPPCKKERQGEGTPGRDMCWLPDLSPLCESVVRKRYQIVSLRNVLGGTGATQVLEVTKDEAEILAELESELAEQDKGRNRGRK
jgi:hypothetical protein